MRNDSLPGSSAYSCASCGSNGDRPARLERAVRVEVAELLAEQEQAAEQESALHERAVYRRLEVGGYTMAAC